MIQARAEDNRSTTTRAGLPFVIYGVCGGSYMVVRSFFFCCYRPSSGYDSAHREVEGGSIEVVTNIKRVAAHEEAVTYVDTGGDSERNVDRERCVCVAKRCNTEGPEKSRESRINHC